PSFTLETSHEVLGDAPQRQLDLQLHMTSLLRRERWHLDIFRPNAQVFLSLLGTEIDIELAPYLRIVRPDRPEDNIGIHRDTVYGASPFEISVFVPFVDLDDGAALRVEPGSHLKSEAEIPFVRTESADPLLVKGSPKHQLGYPYAPQVLDERYPLKTVP